MPITVCVLLWALRGQENSLVDYEDQVLENLPAHGARVLMRARAAAGDPHEVQVLEFPSEESLAAFMRDPRRTALAPLRDRAVARAEVLRVDLIGSGASED